MKGRILTWDNIIKTSFTRPSRCVMCCQMEESTNHLLNTCIFIPDICDWGVAIFHQSHRKKTSIQRMIENWRDNFTKNEMVILLWNLLLGCIVWNVWKERNCWIFQNREWPNQAIKDKIIHHMRETFLICVWSMQAERPSEHELAILEFFGLSLLVLSNRGLNPRMSQVEQLMWSPPC